MFDFQAYVNEHKSSKNNHDTPSYHDLMQWVLESLDNSGIMNAKSTLPGTIIEHLYNDIRQRKDNDLLNFIRSIQQTIKDKLQKLNERT